MINVDDNVNDDNDPFDLTRFIIAQKNVYDCVLTELRRGKKQTHWMWYIFPQIDGLGHSSTSIRYSIKSIEEARSYLSHPILGARLFECSELVLDIEQRSVSEIFGYPDDTKLRSSMTLFASISDIDSIFNSVLEKFFYGHRDSRTIQILESL